MIEKQAFPGMGTFRRMAIFSLVAVAVSIAAVKADTYAEMDTSVRNDFWDCTGRVNPSITTGSGTIAALDAVTADRKETERVSPFESRYLTEVLTDAMCLDTRRPFAMIIRIR